MSKLTFTSSQEKAINTLTSNVSISAGAGSGKTEVLVQRFCNIVEQDLARVEEILTVTYTEKAAKEMKERIVRRFEDRFLETGDTRYEEARRGVESAYIGTIHSFASRILRENAFDAGVDPKFVVLDEPEAATLTDEVLNELFAVEYEKGTAEYRDLAYAYGKDGIKASVKHLHSHAATLGKDISGIPVASLPEGNPKELLETYFSSVDGLFSEMDKGKLKGAIIGRLQEFGPKYEDLKWWMNEALGWTKITDPAAYSEVFNWDIFGRICWAPKFMDGRVGSESAKLEFIEPAREAAKQFLDVLVTPIARYYATCLKHITGNFRSSYRNAKRVAGALDFNDLLLAAKSLLLDDGGQQTETAVEYMNKFKFVVMDEFQDTNGLQKSIMTPVCRPDRFFTVGDIKQSIFGFIQSDVDVFIDHHDRIKKGAGLPLSFVENFRSRPGIIGFVNWLFRDIWAEDQDFEFEELKAEGSFHGREGTDAEILLVPKTRSTDEARLLEARAIASRINELLGRNGNPPLKVTRKRGDEPPRDLQPGDIMILFRATAAIPLYERVLTDAGIECYVVSGRGFFQTHEVCDMLNLLRVVDNPLNDVAMAAVLRSPMVNISDDTLWWLTRLCAEVELEAPEIDESDTPPRNRSIGKIYSGICGLDGVRDIEGAERERLLEFREILRSLHELRSDSRITRLLDAAISSTHYDLKILASTNGKRKFANIYKLIDLARSFEMSRLFSLSDFIRHVDNLTVVAGREGEAATETEDSSVVRLMTVHKAKGLQAPVVIVADSARTLNTNDSSAFLFGKNTGIGCKIKNPLTDDWIKTSVHVAVGDSLKNKDIKEEKRLFYVATTRAEELLIISGSSSFQAAGSGKSYRDTGCWSGWIEKAFQISGMPDGGEAILFAGDAPVRLYTIAAAGTEGREQAETVLQARREDFISGKRGTDDGSARGVIDRCFAAASGKDVPVRMTVSQALTFSECPRKYYYRWVLGIHDQQARQHEDVHSDSETASAATIGTAVHDALASLDFRADVRMQMESLVERQEDGLRDDVRRACRRFIGSPWLQRIISADEVMQEVPFNARFDRINLLGRIDLLFRDSTGWNVADYKTGSAGDTERYREQVGLYALTVKQCLRISPTEAAIIALGDGRDHVSAVDTALLEEAEQSLRDTVQAIADQRFDAKEDSCSYCAYNGWCRRSPKWRFG